MQKEDFERLKKSVRAMVADLKGEGPPAARQYAYVGKVLTEIKVNGATAWSLKEATADLKDLDLTQIESYADLIKAMIETLNQTDEGFAQLLGVPVGTIRGWKSGRRSPRGASQKLIHIGCNHPNVVFKLASEDSFQFA